MYIQGLKDQKRSYLYMSVALDKIDTTPRYIPTSKLSIAITVLEFFRKYNYSAIYDNLYNQFSQG